MVNEGHWYFVYNGIKYADKTKVWFTDEFYKTHKVRSNSLYFTDISPSIFTYNCRDNSGKMRWVFSNVTIEDFNPDRDIKEIIEAVYYVDPRERAAKRVIDGSALSLLAGNILLYIVGILVVIPFNGRLWAWIVMTYLFIASCMEKLSR